MRLNIFISSSTDNLEEEREAFRDVVYNLNEKFGQYCDEIDCRPLRWEKNVRRDFQSHETFQQIINEVLNKAHVVVFVFCNRLGEHTKEEWDSVLKTDKHILTFKKTWSPNLTSMSLSQIEEMINEYKDFRAFSDTIERDKPMTEFADLQEFKIVLSEHLEKVILGYLISSISKCAQWETSKDRNAQVYLNYPQPLNLH